MAAIAASRPDLGREVPLTLCRSNWTASPTAGGLPVAESEASSATRCHFSRAQRTPRSAAPARPPTRPSGRTDAGSGLRRLKGAPERLEAIYGHRGLRNRIAGPVAVSRRLSQIVAAPRNLVTLQSFLCFRGARPGARLRRAHLDIARVGCTWLCPCPTDALLSKPPDLGEINCGSVASDRHV